MDDKEDDCKCDRATWAGELGFGATILALCLGLSMCSVADSYSKKLQAETVVLKSGAPK